MKKQYNITRHANGFLVERGHALGPYGFSGGSGGNAGGSLAPEAFFFVAAANMAEWLEKDLSVPASGLYVTIVGGGGGGGNDPLPTFPKRTRKRKAKARK